MTNLREVERNLMAIALEADVPTAARIATELDEEDLEEPAARWLLLQLASSVGRGHAYHDLIARADENQALYLDNLHARYVSQGETDTLLAELKAVSRRRRARLVLGKALERVTAGEDAAINDALAELADLVAPRSANKVRTTAEILRSSLDRMASIRAGKLRSWIPLGLGRADRMLAIQPGQLVMIGGRTGSGKTALGVNLVASLSWLNRVPTLYLNSEMAGSEMGLRLAARMAGLDLAQLRVSPTDDDEAQVRKLIDQYGATPSLITDAVSSLTSADVAALARYHHAANGIQVVVLDYVQRLRDWFGRNDLAQWQMFMEIAMQLKSLATDLGIIVICLAQLNSAGELAASKGMANDCDLVLMLERCADESDTDERKRRDKPPREVAGQTHLLRVEKGRHIPGDLEFRLAMNPVTLCFSEVTG